MGKILDKVRLISFMREEGLRAITLCKAAKINNTTFSHHLGDSAVLLAPVFKYIKEHYGRDAEYFFYDTAKERNVEDDFLIKTLEQDNLRLKEEIKTLNTAIQNTHYVIQPLSEMISRLLSIIEDARNKSPDLFPSSANEELKHYETTNKLMRMGKNLK